MRADTEIEDALARVKESHHETTSRPDSRGHYRPLARHRPKIEPIEMLGMKNT